METSPASVEQAILSAINAVSTRKFDFLEKTMPIEHMGIDSITLSQVVLHIESAFAKEIPESVLVQLSEVATVGQFVDYLRDFYEAPSG